MRRGNPPESNGSATGNCSAAGAAAASDLRTPKGLKTQKVVAGSSVPVWSLTTGRSRRRKPGNLSN